MQATRLLPNNHPPQHTICIYLDKIREIDNKLNNNMLTFTEQTTLPVYSTFSLHASHLLAPKQQPTTLFYNLRELRSKSYSPFSNPSVCPRKEECKLQTSCHFCKREMTITHYYDNLNDVN